MPMNRCEESRDGAFLLNYGLLNYGLLNYGLLNYGLPNYGLLCQETIGG